MKKVYPEPNTGCWIWSGSLVREHGQVNPMNNAKLNPDSVRIIRKEFNNGGISVSALGRKFMVSHTTIKDVLTGKNWSHVQ